MSWSKARAAPKFSGLFLEYIFAVALEALKMTTEAVTVDQASMTSSSAFDAVNNLALQSHKTIETNANSYPVTVLSFQN
ncbi:hypothetical protein EJB05_42596 [Eragrostis curvula]|uniref:Uncharacterized protein n=1 Tax=Eragrostis curvula TaxID=38414 RepID=A0A5J9TCX4_9POAL|nr:hypothetical protein EJB05_42596 [Eragrostis curvula]